MDFKAKFFQAYANLPNALRQEIIIVVEDKTFSWNSAKLEIENNSKIGRLILKKLVDMEIIKND